MTKNHCLKFLSLNLANTANWRRLQALRWPDDARNEQAARILFSLASQATNIDDAVWDRMSPFYNPKDGGWYETVSGCSRDIGFRVAARTFDDYLQTILDALTVSA